MPGLTTVGPFVNARQNGVLESPPNPSGVGRLDLDQLGPPAGTVHDPHGATRHGQRLRQQIDERGICGASNGRRLDLDLDRVTLTAHDAVAGRTRLEMHLQAHASGVAHEPQYRDCAIWCKLPTKKRCRKMITSSTTNGEKSIPPANKGKLRRMR